MKKIKHIIFSNLPVKLLHLYHKKKHAAGLEKWKSSKYIFLHIPKAAGTSINKALSMPDLGHLTYDELLKTDDSFSAKEVYFCVFRDPLPRIKSAYNYAKKLNMKGYSTLSAFANYNTFEGFLDSYINAEIVRDHYFLKPSSLYIKNIKPEKTYIINFDALKDEDSLLEITKLIEKFANKEICIPHLNKSEKKESYDVDNHILEKINKLYADDLYISKRLKNKIFITGEDLF